MKIILFLLAFMTGLFLSSAASFDLVNSQPTELEFSVLYLEIDSAISPAQEDLLEQALEVCAEDGHDMLLVRLDTPGGLAESMRNMVMQILNAPVPVGVWVGPSGARAASAGVFLVAASSISGMAPQSTIGAASPVGSGGEDIPETMAKKVKNDLLSLVRSVATARGRNVEWYQQAVEESVSITASEAAMTRVVEFVASDKNDFMDQVLSRGLVFKDSRLDLSGRTVTFTEHLPGFRYKFLSWLLDPQIAYFLLLGGMAGLFFELTTPGAVLPGVFGGLCLLLGLYAMSVLPTNVAGLLLIIFGLVLFGLEIKIVSFGMLGLAGTASLFIGSVILFKGGQGFDKLPMTSILVTVAGLSLLLGSGVYLIAKASRKDSVVGVSTLIGEAGHVLEWKERKGTILIRGEIWNAVFFEENGTLEKGDTVRVREIDGLTLRVARDI